MAAIALVSRYTPFSILQQSLERLYSGHPLLSTCHFRYQVKHLLDKAYWISVDTLLTYLERLFRQGGFLKRDHFK